MKLNNNEHTVQSLKGKTKSWRITPNSCSDFLSGKGGEFPFLSTTFNTPG